MKVMVPFTYRKLLFSAILIAIPLSLFSQDVKPIDQLQREYVALEFGMFIHFSMNTFSKCCCPQCYSVSGEWENKDCTDKPDKFNPSKLDCGQWARVAKSAGMKYMVLTAKHHGGFCTFPSAYTEYDVAASPWKDGKGDVVKEFVDSARAYGLEVGLYYSIRDWCNGYDTTFIKNQLSELLTNYGQLRCLWFDGWKWDGSIGYTKVPYHTVRNLIKSKQPNCLLIENNHYGNLDSTEIMEYEYPVTKVLPPANNKLPAEVCMTLRSDQIWFWHPLAPQIKTTASILQDLKDLSTRNSAYLLDLTPDTSGQIPQNQVDRMKEVGIARGIGIKYMKAISGTRPVSVTVNENVLVVENIPADHASTVAIYDLSGKSYRFPAHRNHKENITIDIAGLAKGVYFLNYQSGTAGEPVRFIIE
jgi:alpha-L-fucosidase